MRRLLLSSHIFILLIPVQQPAYTDGRLSKYFKQNQEALIKNPLIKFNFTTGHRQRHLPFISVLLKMSSQVIFFRSCCSSKYYNNFKFIHAFHLQNINI